jgi:hypothetical protein
MNDLSAEGAQLSQSATNMDAELSQSVTRRSTEREDSAEDLTTADACLACWENGDDVFTRASRSSGPSASRSGVQKDDVSEDGATPSLMDDLSEDALRRVFASLPDASLIACRAVCADWRALASEPSAWRQRLRRCALCGEKYSPLRREGCRHHTGTFHAPSHAWSGWSCCAAQLADAPGCRTGAHRQSDVVPAGRGREVAIRRVRIHGGSGHSSSATVHNLLRCDVCHNQYSDWVCCHDEWRGLPASLHDSCLCRACFEGLRRSPFAWAYFLTSAAPAAVVAVALVAALNEASGDRTWGWGLWFPAASVWAWLLGAFVVAGGVQQYRRRRRIEAGRE